MLKKRIIPCLDIKDGRTVKGINFVDIQDAGDPIELAKRYVKEGADELVFLDITATVENRKTLVDLVQEIAQEINIPFTVGGGINTLSDVENIIKAGADKVSVNSSAVKNPELISEIANQYGSQCVVVAIDTKFVDGEWMVFVHGGRTRTPLKTIEWAKKVTELGAGEILLTSMNNDGTKAGFAMDITNEVSQAINIPVIASGGAGSKAHFSDLFTHTEASAGLAASIFHYSEIPITELKYYLQNNNIPVRITENKKSNIMNIDFKKGDSLVPVIVQNNNTLQVLMLGYMNEKALKKTKAEQKVTFYSRSKNRLWTKGEESGNFLLVKSIELDCDNDTLLIKVDPVGPTCHKGTTTCFADETSRGFIYELEQTISQRIDDNDESSYTNQLYRRGINKVAQKVGEEAVELVIEAKDNDANLFKSEAADLMYHYLILLKAKGYTLEDIETILKDRAKK